MSLLDDLEEELEVLDEAPPPVALVPEVVESAPKALTKREKTENQLRRLEDDLLRQNMTIIADAGYFREIDPDMEEPPKEWILELGKRGAKNRLRMAKAAWLNAKEAPVGLAVAKSVMTGIIKARAAEKDAPRSLNIAVAVNMSLPKLEIVEVEE